jgi:hypothetical protein
VELRLEWNLAEAESVIGLLARGVLRCISPSLIFDAPEGQVRKIKGVAPNIGGLVHSSAFTEQRPIFVRIGEVFK